MKQKPKKPALPPYLIVGASRFKIIRWHPDLASSVKRYAEIDMVREEIRIDFTFPHKLAGTVVHEILHAVWTLYNLHAKEDDEERIVTTLATGITHVLAQNPKLAEWLAYKLQPQHRDEKY